MEQGSGTGPTAALSTDFGSLLKRHRQNAGLSQSSLAQQVQVDQSYINRLERGDREPPKRPLVAQLATAMTLSDADRQRLLLAAGHVPDWLLTLQPDDPTLLAVARFLASPGVSATAKKDLRTVINLVLAHWQHANG